MRILFLGTPEAAVPFLEVCVRRHEVVAVITQPDRPSGRGLKPAPSPVKTAAISQDIEVLQPEKPGLIVDRIRSLGTDMAVVVAYGRILKPDVLSATRLGYLNVHFSLLPKYRGAAPIQWSLIAGEATTGVTLFWLDAGMDTGPIQARCETSIDLEDDAPALTQKLIRLGVPLLEETLGTIAQDRIRRDPQVGEPSLAPRLTRHDARIDFAVPALDVHNRIRGLRAGPRAFTTVRNSSVTLLASRVDSEARETQGTPGILIRVERERGVLVQCSTGRLWITQVQPEGKRQIPAVDFVNGLRLKPGDHLVSNE